MKQDQTDDGFLAERVQEASGRLQVAKDEIAREIWGQENIIELTLACMVAGGHLLAEGVPGLAKTRLVSRVATVMGLDWKRIQFTPDLMPSDILGYERADENAENGLRFVRGPLFTQFLMADEINRGSPKTQSALLEAMQERKVTVAGTPQTLQRPYTVMATQNPLEQEGTYPLPEAQLDRFLMKLNFDYPDEESEKRVIRETTYSTIDIRDLYNRVARGEDFALAPDKDNESRVQAVLNANELIFFQTLARSLPLTEKMTDAIAKIVRRARPADEKAPKSSLQAFINENVAWAPGPRAGQAFAQVAKARALIQGRLQPDISDLKAIALPVLEHRMALKFSAGVKDEPVTIRQVIEKLTHDL